MKDRPAVFVAMLFFLLICGFTSTENAAAAAPALFTDPVVLGDTVEFFEREGMQKEPEVWEDGIREATGPGHYEWWYFNARFDDGYSVVLVYLTKPYENINKPLTPSVYIDIKGAVFRRIWLSPLILTVTLTC
ncbi:MAG: hypothetical protein WCQ99_07200 [Pseudomonadota bacterium]